MIRLCIPTLNRYDLLAKCLSSVKDGVVRPENIYIIDNGKQLPKEISDICNGWTELFIYTPETNLGVSKSWNWFIDVNKGHPVLIVNDDIEFSITDFGAFVSAYKSDLGEFYYTNNISSLNMFSCFLMDSSLVDKIGGFDEHFFPAYYEDNDYFRRMKLAGIRLYAVNTNLRHTNSSTIAKYTDEQKMMHHQQFQANAAYYQIKWGGLPHQEQFTKPFNGHVI